jgi:carbon storage regulator CsrA
MLVLTRKVGEGISIGKNQEIVIKIGSVRGERVRLGFEADASIPVHRVEPDKVTLAASGCLIVETHNVVGFAH